MLFCVFFHISKKHPDRYKNSPIRRTFFTYEVLKNNFIKFAKNVIRYFDNGLRHFDVTKPQKLPLTQLTIGECVRCFDIICAMQQRFPQCQKVVF